MYASLPVGRYVQSKIKESGMKRVEIIRQCGWKNVTKGLRRLDALIQDSSPDTDLLKKLIDVIKLDREELERHMRETNTIWELEIAKCEKERISAWKPFLYERTELKRPTSITCSAFFGGMERRYNRVPAEVLALPFEKQLVEVGRLVRDYYAKKSGKAIFFGAIVGYLYQYTHNYGVEFSIDGRIIGEKKEFFDPPIHSLRIGNKIISGGMFSNL
jgi:hypothetical protein